MSSQTKKEPKKIISNNISGLHLNIPLFHQTKQIYELTGKSKKHIHVFKSKEIKQFSNIKVKQFPNSKRVISPEQNINNTKLVQRKKTTNNPTFNKESNQFSLISKVDYHIKPKPLSPTHRESYDFANKNGNNFTSLKRSNKITPYGNYSMTTQIVNLPGCIKRDYGEIKDDQTTLHKFRPFSVEFANGSLSTRESCNNKMKNDYLSNVDCLPGSKHNAIYKAEVPLRRQFNNKSQSDIFHLKVQKNKEERQNINGDLLFNVSHKRIYPDKNNAENNIKEGCGLKRNGNKNISVFKLI